MDCAFAYQLIPHVGLTTVLYVPNSTCRWSQATGLTSQAISNPRRGEPFEFVARTAKMAKVDDFR